MRWNSSNRSSRFRIRDRGSILISGLIAIVVIGGLSAALFTTVIVENDLSKMNSNLVSGAFLADGGADVCEKLILRRLSNYEPLPVEGDFHIQGFDVHYLTRVAADPKIFTDADGLHSEVQPLLVTAAAEVNRYRENINRILLVARTPIFQFAVFYDQDLEILPGADMTITGRIHSNRDIYMGVEGDLTVDSGYLRAVGDLYRMRKNDGSLTGGNVQVRINDGSGNFASIDSRAQLLAQGIPSQSGLDSNFRGWDSNGDGDFIDIGEMSPWAIEAVNRFQGTVQTAEHGMRELVPPSVQSLDRYEEFPEGDYERDEVSGQFIRVPPGTGSYRKGYYHRNADLVILDNEVFDRDGNPVNVPPGTITEASFYDAREGTYITVTDVDLLLLGEAGLFPANGLLYSARSDSRAGSPNAVRLRNGKELAGDLTVVSEGPVYTLGHYNTVNKKAAAIMSDAYNLLSKDWDDSKSPGTLPVASKTGVAAAILTGSYSTTPGNYNGGFENLVRFHENWTGVPCVIRGSFVNVYDARIATGRWVYGGDHYTAPVRNWDFDPAFNDVEGLPPFTPMVIHVRGVAWFDRIPDSEVPEQ